MHGVNVAAIVIDKGADGEMKNLENQTWFWKTQDE